MCVCVHVDVHRTLQVELDGTGGSYGASATLPETRVSASRQRSLGPRVLIRVCASCCARLRRRGEHGGVALVCVFLCACMVVEGWWVQGRRVSGFLRAVRAGLGVLFVD